MQEEKESVWVNSIYTEDDFSFNQRDGLFEENKKANEESERKDGKNEGEEMIKRGMINCNQLSIPTLIMAREARIRPVGFTE